MERAGSPPPAFRLSRRSSTARRRSTALEERATEAAGNGAELVAFPETYVSIYPSSRWAQAFAKWDDVGAKETFARIAQNAAGGRVAGASGASARPRRRWASGSSPASTRSSRSDRGRPQRAPHPRARWPARAPPPQACADEPRAPRLGSGDGRGLTAVETGFGRLGGLICWRITCRWRVSGALRGGGRLLRRRDSRRRGRVAGDACAPGAESRAYVIAPRHFQRAFLVPR